MTDKIREVLNILDQENISYEILEHPPVYTIGEVQDAGLPKEEVIAKNLFVRNDRKDQYMLLVVPGDRRVNLKAFRRAMGTRPLSFASGEELSRIRSLSGVRDVLAYQKARAQRLLTDGELSGAFREAGGFRDGT